MTPPHPAPPSDSGLACLVMLARFHQIPANAEQLRHDFGEGDTPLEMPALLQAARALGLRTRRLTASVERLPRMPLPAIGIDARHGCFILARADEDKILIQRPGAEQPEVMPLAALRTYWSGTLILLQPRGANGRVTQRFGLRWFLPALHRHRGILLEVLAASLFLQVFALITPLFFQVVMDKVLAHQGLSTLNVLMFGLLAVVVFESVLSGLRGYVSAHTASRIDVTLGSRLYQHLVNLPLAYFQTRRVGDSAARVRELENIRSFLTGSSITLVIDVLFCAVFLAVMLMYSPVLTLVVIGSLPLYLLLALGITPLLRTQLHETFGRGAENQAFLVESLTGITTLKALAVEPQARRRWDTQLAAYVGASFRTQVLSTLANESAGLIGKLVTVLTLWLGARQVIDGHLSVGQLIAFNMLAGRIAQPVMRLAQLWPNFQQTRLSMQRLGDILDTPTESATTGRNVLPALRGGVEFHQVHFRYRPDGPAVLQDFSLQVAPGEVIGIVGSSGSGKSTLARLLQRLHVPEQGRITVDGIDLALTEASSLRRQMGVVLQENMLFHRSVRDNIALTDPGASLDTVVHAARLAGAHDFILDLPEGYDTVVGEHGASLSGGQRQRVAIARALLRNPRILIFDEATSALDYESERLIQANMRQICAGRTVLIIAHRLSTVRSADRIVVLERGQLVEQGNPAQLLARPDSRYAQLHRMQQG